MMVMRYYTCKKIFIEFLEVVQKIFPFLGYALSANKKNNNNNNNNNKVISSSPQRTEKQHMFVKIPEKPYFEFESNMFIVNEVVSI